MGIFEESPCFYRYNSMNHIYISCSKLYTFSCRLDHKRKKPPTYKVMLHNDNRNKRDYVVKVLLKVVEGLTVEDATVVMQVSTLLNVLLHINILLSFW